MTELAQPCSMQPLIVLQTSPGLFSWQWRVSRKRESIQGLLSPRLRTGSVSLSLIFSGQNKSQGSPDLRGGEKTKTKKNKQTLPFLEGSSCKVKIKGIWENQGFLFLSVFQNELVSDDLTVYFSTVFG